jgi:hypothetical protein
MIPQVFHHVWLGSSKLPPKAEELRSTWRDLHPDWRFRLWTESDLQWLRNYRLFYRSPSYSQKSDFARWEIIGRFGGVYLDTDMECLKQLDGLVQDSSFFGGREPSDSIATCIFGAEPRHPFVCQVSASMPIACWSHPDIMHQTGPGLVSTVFRNGKWGHRPDLRIYPASFFNAYGPVISEPGAPPPTESYAVHHAVFSWKDNPPVKANLRDCLPRTLHEARIVAGQLTERARGSLDYRVIGPVRKRLVTGPQRGSTGTSQEGSTAR